MAVNCCSHAEQAKGDSVYVFKGLVPGEAYTAFVKTVIGAPAGGLAPCVPPRLAFKTLAGPF